MLFFNISPILNFCIVSFSIYFSKVLFSFIGINLSIIPVDIDDMNIMNNIKYPHFSYPSIVAPTVPIMKRGLALFDMARHFWASLLFIIPFLYRSAVTFAPRGEPDIVPLIQQNAHSFEIPKIDGIMFLNILPKVFENPVSESIDTPVINIKIDGITFLYQSISPFDDALIICLGNIANV